MKFVVDITSVDGTTNRRFETEDRKVALEFLTNADHEGSCISLDIRIEDPDQIYKILRDEDL